MEESDKNYYIIYRVSELHPNEAHIHCWTNTKRIAKAFLQQRDRKKYRMRKISLDEIGESHGENDFPFDTQINCVKLKSSQTGDDFILFMPIYELNHAEKNIQRMMIDQTSLIRNPDIEKNLIYFVTMLVNLDQVYQDALEFIGYRPTEVDYIFDQVSSRVDDLCDTIDLAYGENYNPREYIHDMNDKIPGLSMIEDVSKQILYSLESFIKVMKHDM